jgi:hypothetical protein
MPVVVTAYAEWLPRTGFVMIDWTGEPFRPREMLSQLLLAPLPPPS